MVGIYTGRLALIVCVGVGLLMTFSGTRAAPPVQTGTRIHYGDTVSGEITEAESCRYFWFEGRAGDAITAEMIRTSGSLDGVLALYLRDGANFTAAPIAHNDDRADGGLDPLLAATLPETDWYTFAACRLQSDTMRPTTGTFSLSLTGPETPSGGGLDASPTPPANLTAGLFETEEAAGSAMVASTATPTPTPSPSDAGVLPGLSAVGSAQATPTLGVDTPTVIVGRLEPNSPAVQHPLPIRAGDQVVIDWQRVSGDLPPQVTVFDPDGVLIARAGTRDIVYSLQLVFQAPADATLTIEVARYGDQVDATAGDYELRITINAGGPTVPTPGISTTAAPPIMHATPVPEGYLAAACRSGADALAGPLDGDQITNVYLAAGDGYLPSQVVPTVVFRPDDDLNVVFTVPDADDPGDWLVVAVVFCAPDGTAHDAGEDLYAGGDSYLMGLDWEMEDTLWESGDWFAEVYIDEELDLILAFQVN